MRNNQPINWSKNEMRSPRNYIFHGLFFSLYAFFKYCSFPFFNYFRFLVLKVFCKKIRSTAVSDGVTIWFPWNLEIGKDSSLNQGVIIDGTGGVKIGNGVRIAPYVVINTADHEFSDSNMMIKDQGFLVAPIVIEDDVWIGAAVVINKGVTIGKGSVIGAGSVVTKDIPPYSVAVGVPCKVIRSRELEN
jgi:acetyltransferase-like isoleucine patch superfamily enzyme